MSKLTFKRDIEKVATYKGSSIPVVMYGKRAPAPDTGSVGGPVLEELRRLRVSANRRAFDLLTVAMAVTAADSFVSKFQAADGWSRELSLRVPVSDPAPWVAAVPTLKRALDFLSGDQWEINTVGGGPKPPPPYKRPRNWTDLKGHDCVCLFSGGLDSAIGVLDLVRTGHRPLLVSHAYTRDASKQEIIKGHLPPGLSRFAAMANPVCTFKGRDVQMRTRSFNFLAYGAVIGATLVERFDVEGPITLVVPENGLIALNPPLTARRIGALSTRTTHPHFLELMQKLFDELEIPVRIENPYADWTKGEMMAQPENLKTLSRFADQTVSCGKWKRKGVQCGKCVPCLIRRASFHAAGIEDDTRYDPAHEDLRVVIEMPDDVRDDLLAMVLACRRLPQANMPMWLAKTGPLPRDEASRAALVGVAERGLGEVRAYLDDLGLIR